VPLENPQRERPFPKVPAQIKAGGELRGGPRHCTVDLGTHFVPGPRNRGSKEQVDGFRPAPPHSLHVLEARLQNPRGDPSPPGVQEGNLPWRLRHEIDRNAIGDPDGEKHPRLSGEVPVARRRQQEPRRDIAVGSNDRPMNLPCVNHGVNSRDLTHGIPARKYRVGGGGSTQPKIEAGRPMTICFSAGGDSVNQPREPLAPPCMMIRRNREGVSGLRGHWRKRHTRSGCSRNSGDMRVHARGRSEVSFV